MTSAVALERAEVRVDGRAILGPLDLTVRAGEHWVVLGPNGGGKTTLLSLAGAWRQPSRGHVRVLGEELGRVDVRQLRRRIGHVSHAVADRLRPALPVRDVVLTGKSAVLETWWLGPSAEDLAQVDALLAEVGCAALADRPLGTCSMGERQRVLIARALFGAHRLLLLDEPAAGLDLSGRELLLGAVVAAAERPDAPTTILATHHLEEVPPTATHAALLREGCLVAAGRIEDVLTDERLSACYGIGVRVERRAGRWWARAV
ncbi:MAG: ABC transporter ATP-binding protein [Actinomycetota bacterium]